MKRTFLAASLFALLGAQGATAHPLDGLTADEYVQIRKILTDAGIAGEKNLFPLIELVEPAKAEVLAWKAGDSLDRRASVNMSSDQGFRELVVNLTQGKVESDEAAAGQPMVLFDEFLGAMQAAVSHPDMVAGLEKRGIKPDQVFCLPLTVGNFYKDEFGNARLMKVPCYMNPEGSNFYAKPIEGLYAIVDLTKKEALKVLDTGVVPVAQDP